MVILSREFTLKDGRKAVLRSPEEKDAEGLVWMLRETAKETDFIIRTLEDCSRYTLESEKDVIRKKSSSKTEVLIICEVDGEIAGSCSIHWKDFVKVRHSATIGIALCKKYWNLGIGTEMFKEVIRIAEEDSFITQLKLTFIEGNSRARTLYEKMGFKITGVNPRYVRLKNGQYLDEYEMIKILNK